MDFEPFQYMDDPRYSSLCIVGKRNGWFLWLWYHFTTLFHTYGGLLGQEGCFITAVRNSMAITNFTLPGQINPPDLRQMVHFLQEHNFLDYEANLMTGDLANYLNLSIVPFNQTEVVKNPQIVNDWIDQGNAVIMRFNSPSGKNQTHFVNVHNLKIINDQWTLFYNETNLKFKEKGSTHILVDDLYKQRFGQLRMFGKKK